MRCVLPILLLVLGTTVSPGADPAEPDEDEIQVCTDENGNITLQDDPCPELPKKEVARRTPVAARPKARPRPKVAAPPSSIVAHPPKSSSPARRARTSWVKLPPPAAPPAKRTIGNQRFPTRLENAARSAPPSFTSPERTWQSFLAAIESDDSTAAIACLTPAAREKLGSDPDTFPMQEWREMVNTFTHIDNDGDLGPFWSIHGKREGRRPKWIYFEKTRDGEWKIAGI